MNRVAVYFIISLMLIATTSCGDELKDEDAPVIDMSLSDAFPQNCAVVYRGESFNFRAKFTDNIALGSYSIEMHHNFDHHSHSTSVVECDMDPVKQAVKPFRFIDEFSIPASSREFVATGTISIPADVDTGDYHFAIRLTDDAGWQTFVGISMKIADRK